MSDTYSAGHHAERATEEIHDNPEAAHMHALLSIAAAIDRLADQVERLADQAQS